MNGLLIHYVTWVLLNPRRTAMYVWMRRSGDLYEYIAVYTDDLLIGSKDPKKITDTLENVHGFKLKAV